MLIEVLNSFPNEQIYVNHEIIHNDFVIRVFEKRGVIFESDIEKIPNMSSCRYIRSWYRSKLFLSCYDLDEFVGLMRRVLSSKKFTEKHGSL